MKDKDVFENHALWTTIAELQTREDLKELEIGTKNYLKALLVYMLKRKDYTNHYYVSETSLDTLQDCLINISAYIPNRPDRVESYIDEAFNELATTWPAMAGSRVVDITESTFRTLMNDMAQQIAKAHNAVDVVEETKEAYKAEIDQLEVNINEYEKIASEKIDAIVTKSKELSEELNEQLEASIEEFNSKVEESQSSIKERYISDLSAIGEEAQILLDKVSDKASKISGKVIADSYGEYARNKAMYKVVYDVFAVIFAIVGIFLVGYAVVGMHADETSATVYKTAISLASFTISGFLFKRGTYEQREAKAAKRTELTLKQYESFIANLDEEEKDRITRAIADRIFIKGEIDNNVPTLSESIMQRKSSSPEVKELIELLRLAMKADS